MRFDSVLFRAFFDDLWFDAVSPQWVGVGEMAMGGQNKETGFGWFFMVSPRAESPTVGKFLCCVRVGSTWKMGVFGQFLAPVGECLLTSADTRDAQGNVIHLV